MSKTDKKAKKLERLIGDLKDDQEFKEFLEANKAISSKENIWKNDVSLGVEAEEEAGKKKGKEQKQDGAKDNQPEPNDDEEELDNGRLFLRNLSYECKEEDLEKLFAPYGPLVECSMPLDNFSKKPKGFAYITCMFPEKARKAFKELDGSIFQGRMLHIIPAKSKRDMDQEDELKQSFKQKKVRFLSN